MDERKEKLTRLSGILKGIVIYKQETELMWKLMDKYDHLIPRYVAIG